jgi:ketosteroid isomerase-like protein
MDATDRFIDALNRKDIAAVEACVHPDFEMIVPQRPRRGFRGREQELKNMQYLFETYPDLSVTLLRKARVGNEVWTETTARAAQLNMAVVTIWTIDDGTGTLLGGRFYSEPVAEDGPDIEEFMHSIGRTQGRGRQGHHMAPAPVRADTYAGVCNTYNRYVQSLDEGDFDAVVDCFTDEGVLIIEGRPERRGKAALRAQYDGRPEGRSDIKHMVCGIWVREEQDDVAHIVAALLLVSLHHGGIVGTGNSYDTLQKAGDGSWRFVEKRVSLSWRAG